MHKHVSMYVGNTGITMHTNYQKYENSTIFHVHMMAVFTTIYLILDYKHEAGEKMSTIILQLL